MKAINLLIIALILLVSCTRETLPDPGKVAGVTGHFSFTLAPMVVNGVTTRSVPSTTVDDTQLTDIWVMQFDNSGNLLKKTYSSIFVPSAFDVALVPNKSGATSNLYFVANIGNGNLSMPVSTETEFKALLKTINIEPDLLLNGAIKKSIPMFGQLLTQTVTATGYISAMSVTLTRILAQIDYTFTVDPLIAASFVLDKVRVCNVPNSIQYFPSVAATFPVLSATSVVNFPLETATAPGPTTVTFYLPENRRGAGTNGGGNERSKTGLPFATYIELQGHTVGSTGGDQVSYKIYPGADNINNYDIVRNTKYALSTTLKGVSVSDFRVTLRERANCYMVVPGASVIIPVKRANESQLGTQIPNTTTGWTASLSWQTSAGLITVDSSIAATGYFKVTAAATKGNAVVVVKNGTGDILWSWQIWVTDYVPEFANNLVGTDNWMLCNLGATVVTTASNVSSYEFDQTAGMLYQWGRKDPFPPGRTFGSNIPLSIVGFTKPIYTGLTTTAVTGDPNVNNTDAAASPISYVNQLAYSVKYPMLFMINWAGSTATEAASALVGTNSWGGEFGEAKSVYDPCPEGWRVPSGKKSSVSYTDPWASYSYVSGTNFSSNYASVLVSPGLYYPVPGYRGGSGDISGIGANSYNLSATTNGVSVYTFYAGNGSVTRNSVSRHNGMSVRCVKNW